MGANTNKAADLDTSVMTVSSRYRHENQNSVYYLKPNSANIYLLDFKLKGFCLETLRWKRGQGLLPLQATSEQTSDASIFVMGGLSTASPFSASTTPSNRSDSNISANALRSCLQIDANYTVYDREQMKQARYATPLALVRDRFILALGGL